MIVLRGLGKQYGAKVLFRDVNLRLEAGCRFGLTGANGAGKSTLLRILCGDEEASDGGFQMPPNARLGILRQDRFLNDADQILAVAMEGDQEVAAALAARDVAMERSDADEMARCDDILRLHDGYSLPARAGAVLEGLGIATHVHHQSLGTLSGGNKLRVLLAQVLLSRPDVLLLDEPTNHLDIVSIRWLERHIIQFAGTAVIISHDARFLDNVATHTLDIDFGTLDVYTGGWTRAQQEKTLRREQKEKTIERIQEQIDHKQAFVDRFGAKNTKAAQAASRKKQIEKLAATLDDLPPSSRRAPAFSLQQQRPSGKEVIELKGVEHSFGDKRVLAGVNLLISRGERVAVIGENGVGKSTLLKIIEGSLTATAGQRRLGHEVQLGWFAQDHREVLANEDEAPVAWLSRRAAKEGLSFVRGMLGKVMFSGDDAHKPIAALSGGEGARLVFAGIMVDKPNVLLLDEPTNHLDIEAIEALTQALTQFEGTVVFVSHDRAFVEALATRVVELRKDSMRDFRGTFMEYLSGEGADHLDASTAMRLQRDAAPAGGGSTGANQWEDAKKRKARKRELEKKRDAALATIERAEARKAAIAVLWAADGYFVNTPAADVKSMQDEDQTLTTTIERCLSEWERCEDELGGEAMSGA
jgi:ATPase subunit of ABC transporter with duplicated ATPase domains